MRGHGAIHLITSNFEITTTEYLEAHSNELLVQQRLSPLDQLNKAVSGNYCHDKMHLQLLIISP